MYRIIIHLIKLTATWRFHIVIGTKLRLLRQVDKPVVINKRGRFLDSLTARRYNLVGVTRRKHRSSRVLGTDTLARKLSRRAPRDRREQRGCKEGMAHFLQPPLCKKCDKQLTFIVRVIASAFIKTMCRTQSRAYGDRYSDSQGLRIYQKKIKKTSLF